MSDDEQEPDPVSPARRGWYRSRAVVFLLRTLIYGSLILAVFYAGVQAHSRTRGFAFLCADRLGGLAGIKLEVGEARLDPALQLSMRNIASTNDVARFGRVEADLIEVRWGLRQGLERVEVNGLRCQAVFLKDMGWRPGLFSGLGNTPVFAQMSRSAPAAAVAPAEESDADQLNPGDEVKPPPPAPPPAGAKPDFLIFLRNVEIRFLSSDETVLARLDGATFLYEPAARRPDGRTRVLLEGWFEWNARRRPRQEIRIEVLHDAERTEMLQLMVDADLLESLQQTLRSVLR